ncbi:MAG TPA: hypothetical protein VG735_08090 [Caulobacterales bacterium]|nr:hypothetical protein [Caulobacterales bacterium]
MKNVLQWVVSYFDFLKSRTNTTLIGGLIAYLLARGGITADPNSIADAIAGAATQAGGAPLSVKDVIVFFVVALGIYFRTNPQATLGKSPPAS